MSVAIEIPNDGSQTEYDSLSVDERIVADFVKNKIELVTTVPCKQLSGVIEKIDESEYISHSFE